MLSHHHRTVAHLAANHLLKDLVRDHFGLPIATALMPAMLARGLHQADLVLCLLRIRDAHSALRSAVESHITTLVGSAIRACPSCLQLYNARPVKPQDEPRNSDDRRITYVSPVNPRQEGTDAHMRWREFRVGRTIGQLVVRGITKRDIHRAARNGWIKIEEVAS